jgi:hypothetical protein
VDIESESAFVEVEVEVEVFEEVRVFNGIAYAGV